jgi:hypothetical protein
LADDREGRTEMKRQRVLVAGAMSVVALAGGTGVANAEPDPFSPPSPGIVNQIDTETPALFVDPADEGGASLNWGGVGMYCQNLFVRCR